jgi:hypothetical protein
MKTWIRIVVSLIVIFFGIGLLLVFKNLQILTTTTGDFILITGTNVLIIGGIVFLSLTILMYRKGSSTGRQVSLGKIKKEAGVALSQLFYDPSNLRQADTAAYHLRRLAAAEKNKEAYDALKRGNVPQNLMYLTSEALKSAEYRRDPSVKRLGSDLGDGELNNPGLLKKSYTHLRNTTQKGLARVLYSLLTTLYPSR